MPSFPPAYVLVLLAFLCAQPGPAFPGAEITMDRVGSDGVRHVRFRMTLSGLPVFDREAAAHLAPGERPRVPAALREPPLLRADPAAAAISPLEATAAVERAAKVVERRAEPRSELGYLAPAGSGRARLVHRVDVPSADPLGDFRAFVDAATGEVLPPGPRDRLRHADGIGRVFDPNPVVTSGDTTLEDLGDADTPLLTAQLFDRPLPLLDGSGFLRGRYCDTRNARGGRALEPTLVFAYTRSDPRFEEVMIYHHVTSARLYLATILGGTPLVDRPIVCEAHGTDEDQAFFSPVTGTLTFGDGGVDGAEDAETIFHEYAHAIQEEIVPGIGESPESEALIEGFADFFAASVSASPERPSFGADCVSDWDAVTYSAGDPPCNRRLGNSRRYPDDLVGQKQEDGQIWSSALWRLRASVGRDVANRLAIECHYHLAPDSGLKDAALALFVADTSLNAGLNHDAIAAALEPHGLLPVNGVLLGNVNAALPPPSFADDGESGGARFSTHATTGNGDFALVVDPLAPSPAHAWRSTEAAAVKDDRLQLPPRVLPAAPSVLRFSHRYDLEPRYDGAVLEYSVDLGPWIDAGPRIDAAAGYDMTLLASSTGPLAGRPAWSGRLDDYAPVVVDLAGLAGLSVRFRWRLGCDASVGGGAWFVDDVSIRPPGGASRADVLLVNPGPPDFFDDLESASAAFATTLAEGSFPFERVESPLATSPTHVFLCPSEDGRKDATLVLGPVALPLNETFLVFRERHRLETGYDGARLYVREWPSGDPVDLGKRIREGGYSGPLAAVNPMGAGPAWTGSSGPLMRRVAVDLADFSGRTVEILFRVACDDSFGGGGAFTIDDVTFGENPGTGGERRRLRVTEGEPFRLEILGPPGGPVPAGYAVFFWDGAPRVDANLPLPFGVGSLPFPIRLHGTAPLPTFILSNVGKENLLGTPDAVPPLAPATALDRPGGFLPPGAYTIQGVILDRNASGRKRASVTNGLVLEVTP